MFNYYDNRNKLRLRKLNVNLTETDEQSIFLKDLSHKLLHVLNSAFKATSALLNAKANGNKETGGNNGDDTTSNTKSGNTESQWQLHDKEGKKKKKSGDGGRSDDEDMMRPPIYDDDRPIRSIYTQNII